MKSWRDRRGLHLYFYFMDRNFGLMHVRSRVRSALVEERGPRDLQAGIGGQARADK